MRRVKTNNRRNIYYMKFVDIAISPLPKLLFLLAGCFHPTATNNLLIGSVEP